MPLPIGGDLCAALGHVSPGPQPPLQAYSLLRDHLSRLFKHYTAEAKAINPFICSFIHSSLLKQYCPGYNLNSSEVGLWWVFWKMDSGDEAEEAEGLPLRFPGSYLLSPLLHKLETEASSRLWQQTVGAPHEDWGRGKKRQQSSGDELSTGSTGLFQTLHYQTPHCGISLQAGELLLKPGAPPRPGPHLRSPGQRGY